MVVQFLESCVLVCFSLCYSSYFHVEELTKMSPFPTGYPFLSGGAVSFLIRNLTKLPGHT